MHLLFGVFFYSLSFFSGVLGLFFMNKGGMVVDFMIPLFFFPLDLSFSFLFDWVSFTFFSVVSLISGSVYFYSFYYMGYSFSYYNDTNRFFMILFFFVLSMFFLVFSFSWLTVMLGWDGLGVVSFLLVIYFNNSSSLDSGLVTIFINRFGDCCFIVMFMGYFYLGSLIFDVLGNSLCFVLFFLTILGCITKSAQVPFSSWLPLAMAAPTPVSSLVHSSTLVTAGVYLLVRFNYLLQDLYFVLCLFSLMTMFLGGLAAVYEKDFKKVVAMSTLSQLGFMVFSISQGLWILCYFHMVFHAFFKSMLFLSTGGLMHNLMGGQDSRMFGGFMSPYCRIVFNMSVLSLCGFPFSMGFYSKDTIVCLILGETINAFSFVFFFSCVFTVCYSLRMVYMGYFLYPSFFSSMGEEDGGYFFFPVLLIYLMSSFLGNYYFLNFFFISSFFSFFDYCLGLFIILFGVLLFMVEFGGFYVLFLGSTSFFLSIISTSLFSSGNKLNYFFLKEMKWGLKLSGEGVNEVSSLLRSSNITFFPFNFSFIVIILFIFLLLV